MLFVELYDLAVLVAAPCYLEERNRDPVTDGMLDSIDRVTLPFVSTAVLLFNAMAIAACAWVKQRWVWLVLVCTGPRN